MRLTFVADERGSATTIAPASGSGTSEAARRIEPRAIAEAVRALLGPAAVALVARVGAVPCRVINAVTAGLWFVDGEAAVDGGVQPFAMVAKALRSSAPSDAAPRFAPSLDPRHYNYWRREPAFYERSPAFGDGLRAPRLLAVDERPDAAVLYLERIRGTPAADWRVADFERACLALGRFQGRIALEVARAPAALPSWASHGVLRAFAYAPPPDALDALDATAAPYYALAPIARRLLASRDALLGAVDAAPRTLCHHDLWAANLIAAHDGCVVLDWAMAGDGALGTDVASLVYDSCWMLQLPLATFDALREHAPDRYVAGLREAGWDGDADAVRRTIATVAALCFGLQLGALSDLSRDPARLCAVDARYGVTGAEVLARRTAVNAAALEAYARVVKA